MDVRAIVTLLSPTIQGAAATLNHHRERAGIAVPLERATLYRWMNKGDMPGKWLGIAGLVVLEQGGMDGFTEFAALLLGLTKPDVCGKLGLNRRQHRNRWKKQIRS